MKSKILDHLKSPVALSAVIIVLFLSSFFYGATHPETDEDFVEKLDIAVKAAYLEGPIPLASVMPLDWDFVCNYSYDGPIDVEAELKRQFALPVESEVKIVEGSSYVTDDESALVFFKQDPPQAWVRHTTFYHIYFAGYERCLSGPSDIYIAIQNKDKPVTQIIKILP